MAHVNAPETAPDCSEAPNMHRGGAVAIDMTDRVPEQSSLRPVLGRVEDTPPAARHDHNPAMHIEGTAELAPTQIPLRIPYTEGWSRDWDALRASTRHRMFANNVTTATSVPRQESTEMDVGSGQREGPFQDSIGWAVRYLAEQDSVTPQKKENESTALTLHRVGSAGWDDPWTFHDALGPESNKEAGATLVSGAHIVHTKHERSQSLLLFVQSNPYFPFFLRLVNIGLITATMAVAIRLRIHLQSSSSESEVGDSPLVAIIFSPPSIAHAFFQTWLEYFSRPIGLWLTSSKLMFTALELVFICLWSAELSLLFDNYFTSTVGCFVSSSPFTHSDHIVSVWNKDSICDLQIVLICVVFVSLLVYIIVFMVCLAPHY